MHNSHRRAFTSNDKDFCLRKPEPAVVEFNDQLQAIVVLISLSLSLSAVDSLTQHTAPAAGVHHHHYTISESLTTIASKLSEKHLLPPDLTTLVRFTPFQI